jgi:hypothetical protein
LARGSRNAFARKYVRLVATTIIASHPIVFLSR